MMSRIFDGAAAFCMTCSAARIVAESAIPGTIQDTLTHWGAIVWSGLLLIGCLSALIGVIFRITKPGRIQSWGFALELAGWPLAGGCVVTFVIAALSRVGLAPSLSIGLIAALGFLLLGNWAARHKAATAARQRDQDEPQEHL